MRCKTCNREMGYGAPSKECAPCELGFTKQIHPETMNENATFTKEEASEIIGELKKALSHAYQEKGD